jgi:hypothetical protein
LICFIYLSLTARLINTTAVDTIVEIIPRASWIGGKSTDNQIAISIAKKKLKAMAMK